MTLFKKTQVGDRRWSREDVDRIKAMIVADFSELLNRQPAEGLQWASTKTDLVELSHLVWESGLLLDERGMPLSFRSIVNRVCAVLNVVPPHNPSGTLEKFLTPIHDCELSLQKIGCFFSVFQKRLFCIAKQPLLPCKTYAFAMQNNRFWRVKA